MKKAFTLVEILIVVSILGILAAIVAPQFRSHAQAARESAAKDNLRVLRTTIERYAATHNGIPPGYQNNDTSNNPTALSFGRHLTFFEHYLLSIPENPFNGKASTRVIIDTEDFPSTPISTNQYGWIYKPATKTIKLNWPGVDSEGISYFDY
jgi:general secretion pathway protein G